MPNATRRARQARLLLLASMLGGCVGGSHRADPGAGPGGADAGTASADAAPAGADAAPGACPAGGAGLACLFALYDEVAGGCDPARLDALRQSLEARHGRLPAWYQGRALFVTYGHGAAVAGELDDWSTTALTTESLCGSDLYVADAAVDSGRYQYRLVTGDTWSLDPENWAFAFDDFAGNADGKNSVLNTYDSGLGHLVQPDIDVCSDELDNCRRFFTYLPAGYGAPQNAGRRYPALFMHDGQNIFDDTDCCFGHTGWEINVELDQEIAAGDVEPVVVVGFPHAGADRIDEYGDSTQVGGEQETFMAFQVDTVQPRAAALWRLDPQRYVVAGSSLGGLLSFRLAFAYPDVYAGAASLSGSFWLGQESGTAMSDYVAATGKIAMPLYLDHGGTAQDGGDNYTDNVALRDQLVSAGWVRGDSPDCARSDDSLCYFHAVGAVHNELAWRDRSFRFLRYFFAAPPGE